MAIHICGAILHSPHYVSIRLVHVCYESNHAFNNLVSGEIYGNNIHIGDCGEARRVHRKLSSRDRACSWLREQWRRRGE